MNYPTRDTEWATSAKGNTWKRTNGIPMIVGKRKDGRWWARRGDDFIKGSFSTKLEAMNKKGWLDDFEFIELLDGVRNGDYDLRQSQQQKQEEP